MTKTEKAVTWAIEIANDKVTIAELKAQIEELKAKESEQNEID